jgi:hypothetical protein
MSDFLYFHYGDTEFPVDAADVSDGHLYQGFDRGRDVLLALFSAAINQELAHTTSGSAVSSSPWYVAQQGTVLANTLPVADIFHEVVSPDVLRESRFSFPLLALYREQATHDEFTLARIATRTTWGLDYILPPLGLDDLRRLGGALNAVKTIVDLVICRSAHPAYEDDTMQFGPQRGNFSSIKVDSSRIGPAAFGPDGENAVYRMLHMQLSTVELSDGVEGINPDFEGFGAGIGVGGFEGIKPNLLEIDTLGFADPQHGIPTP